MKRGQWPDECPLFVVTDDMGEVLPRGSVFEGVGPYNGTFTNMHGRPQYADGVGARILDESQMLRRCGRHPIDGWAGIIVQVGDCKPLTSTAAEMLEIARGRR